MKKFTLTGVLIFTTYLLQAQNVGIGTTEPTAPLMVIANDTGKGIIQKSGAVEMGFYTKDQFGAYVQTWTPHDLKFATGNGTAKFTLSHANGFLGINTPLPTAQMDINGTLRIRGNGAASGKVLTSDAAGNATWQEPGVGVGFSAKLAADLDLPTNTMTNLITYLEEFDDGAVFNHTTGRFTAPSAGVYQINFDVCMEENNTGEKYMTVHVQKNGVAFKAYSFPVAGVNIGYFGNYMGSLVVKLLAGDQIYLAVTRQQVNGSVIHGGSFSKTTVFSGHKLY